MSVLLDVADQPCAVIGGGPVGADRAETLIEHGARVKVISPEISPRIEELLASGAIQEHVARGFEPADVEGCRVVVAATDDSQINRLVFDAADAAGVLCNVAGTGQTGHLQLPAAVRRGALSITVSTSGASPSLARRLRERLEVQFGPEWAELVDLMGELRPEMKAASAERRDEIVDAVIDGMPRAMLAGAADQTLVLEYLRRKLQS